MSAKRIFDGTSVTKVCIVLITPTVTKTFAAAIGVTVPQSHRDNASNSFVTDSINIVSRSNPDTGSMWTAHYFPTAHSAYNTSSGLSIAFLSSKQYKLGYGPSQARCSTKPRWCERVLPSQSRTCSRYSSIRNHAWHGFSNINDSTSGSQVSQNQPATSIQMAPPGSMPVLAGPPLRFTSFSIPSQPGFLSLSGIPVPPFVVVGSGYKYVYC